MKQREKIGKNVSIIGCIINIFLAISKIITGSIFGLISVVADGLNNLFDCASSAISFISFKISSKPADIEHPYGHERAEYVCSLAVSFIILLVAFELLKESVTKIISPASVTFSVIVLVVLIVSIVVKFIMHLYYRSMHKKINSDVLKAASIDSLTDCLSTSVVTISTIIWLACGIDIDGYAGIVVAILIAIAGIGILKEMVSKLIGQIPDKTVFDSVKNRILNHKEVIGVHDLNIYSYGPNKYFASVHIEINANVEVLKAHDLIDEIEREFLNETNIVLTAHHDPIVLDDKLIDSVKRKVIKFVSELDKRFSIHDFRMVKCLTKTDVFFDVEVPFDVNNDSEIVEILTNKVALINKKYQAHIVIDKQIHT